MLLKGSIAAAVRGKQRDCRVSSTAARRYCAIAHGCRIKTWVCDQSHLNQETRRWMAQLSDSSAVLPSANRIHNVAANVQLCLKFKLKGSPPKYLVMTTYLRAGEQGDYVKLNMDCPGLPTQEGCLRNHPPLG